MSGQLRARLLGIGRAAGTRSESGGIRFFALALACLALALAAAAVIVTPAVEAARAGRMADGRLVPAESSPPVLVRMVIDHLREGRQYNVVFLSPAGDHAPLPPGLDHWPRPGTAVVSPELLREGGGQGISGRYGEITGTIGAAGLADATELLAYVRPRQDLDAAADPAVVGVSGFGGAGPVVPGQNVHWLLADQDFPAGALLTMVVLLGVVPSLLLALVAAGVAAHARDRRDALITALGGRVPHRLWIALGEAWAPVLLGALAAVGVITWFTAADRRLPIVDHVVPAADVRGLWWACGLAAVAAAAFVLCAAVLRSAIRGNRPRRKLAGRKVRIALFPCFVLLSIWGPQLFSSDQLVRLLTGYAGLVGAVVTMPAVIGAGVGALGRALAQRGHRPALLTSGRLMAHRPEAIARQVFGVCTCIFFLLFALTMQSNFASNAGMADKFVEEHGYALMEVHPRGKVATAAAVDGFVAAVPKGVEVVAYTETTTGIRVTGTCTALAALTLPCAAEQRTVRADPAERALAAWLRSTGGRPELTVVSGTPSSALDDGTISLLAFTTDGTDIAAGVLNNAGVVFPYGAATSVPGESWYIGAVPPLEQSGWITLIGGYGLVVLVLATGLGLAGEFLRFGRTIAPVSVLTGNRRIYWRTAALVALLPLTAAVAGGFLIGYQVVRPMATTSVNLITPAFVATSCAATLLAGVVMWLWSAAASVGAAGRWRPGRGDD